MYEFLSYRAKHAMTRDPVTIAPDAPLAAAEALFAKHDFNTLPAIDAGGALQGVLTKLDALRGREWDAVVDNTGYVPRHVHESVRLLDKAVGRYLFGERNGHRLSDLARFGRDIRRRSDRCRTSNR